MHTASRSFVFRHLTLCLSLVGLGLSPMACDVEELDDAELAELEAEEAEEADLELDLVDEADPEEPDESCDDEACEPAMDPGFDLVAEPDVTEGTACGGAVQHHHGGDLFPATYQVTMGCNCSSGQTRDFFQSFNTGNGSCSPIGWESPDPRDCRVRMQINRSGGFANGTCNLVVEQNTAGSCFAVQTNTGCNNPSITACVCDVDPFCCNTRWDGICVNEVSSLGCG
jgi:hypothetical protein